MTRKRWTLIAAFLAFALGLLMVHFVPRPLPELSRAEFLSEVRAGHIQKVVVRDNDTILATSSTRGAFRSRYKPGDTDLIAQLRALGVEVVFEDSGLGLI